MITEKTKANAISLLKLGDTPEQVSSELELPYMLVREWYEKLDGKDLTMLSANTNALSKLANSEVLMSSEDNAEILKIKIEETAIKIMDKVSDTVHFPDVIQAKALHLLADTCSKLYNTVINKGKSPEGPQSAAMQSLSMFEQLSRD
jgi:hypothetical protein